MSHEYTKERSFALTMMPFVALLLAAVVLFSGCTKTEGEDDTNVGGNDADTAMMEENNELEEEGAMMEDSSDDKNMEEKEDGAMMDAEANVMVDTEAAGVMIDTEASANVDVTYKLGGKNFAFIMNGEENPNLRVKEGEKVRIEFMSESGFHDWVVDEFGAATTQVQTDGTTSVEFIADKKGTFEYYCSVGKHRENGMKGMLIVE